MLERSSQSVAALRIPDPDGSAGDEDVIARVLRGDVAAFELIMRRHNQRLFRVARAILDNDVDAEDAVQESYLLAFSKLSTFEGRAKLSTWLTRIVVHEAYRHRRRRRSAAGAYAHEPLNPTPEGVLASREIAQIVARAVDALPDAFRLVFMLRIVERLDVAETATCLGISEAAVKTRLHRTRKLLHDELLPEVDLENVHRFLGVRCNRMVATVLERLGAEPLIEKNRRGL
jgi:RNA polymerase sigma-70 factor, ECF subfamily